MQRGYEQSAPLEAYFDWDSTNITKLHNLLQAGRIASIDVPKSRFIRAGFYAGPNRPGSIRSPGGMFIEDIDPKTFDAAFFGINKQAAVAMDPQQRQLLEVVYEALENAGIRLEDVNKKAIGTFVGSYAVGKDIRLIANDNH